MLWVLDAHLSLPNIHCLSVICIYTMLSQYYCIHILNNKQLSNSFLFIIFTQCLDLMDLPAFF
ncbi:hypothetical protein BDB01DRAFT_801361 [Pilobolus umbonatus]|nr:hypothetical protein BDB01DRAFT_801361 [Pilobolus umbonatus]